MRFRALAVLWLAGLVPCSAAAATKIDDPAAFIKGIYARYAKNTGYKPPTDIYTPRLAALFAADARETGAVPPSLGRLDFNVWYDAQDTDDGMPGAVTVSTVDTPGAPGREVVEVTFTNFTPQENRFYFEKSADGWKLDDVTSVSQGWALSLILRYGR